MAKQIIILEKPPGARLTFRFAMWASVPTARQSFYANATAKSGYAGATAAETTAIQLGQVAERVEQISFDPGTATLAAVQATLQTRWADFSNEVAGNNPWANYGTFWDGLTWTVAGVA